MAADGDGAARFSWKFRNEVLHGNGAIRRPGRKAVGNQFATAQPQLLPDRGPQLRDCGGAIRARTERHRLPGERERIRTAEILVVGGLQEWKNNEKKTNKESGNNQKQSPVHRFQSTVFLNELRGNAQNIHLTFDKPTTWLTVVIYHKDGRR